MKNKQDFKIIEDMQDRVRAFQLGCGFSVFLIVFAIIVILVGK